MGNSNYQELVEKRQKHIAPTVKYLHENPMYLVKGDKQFLYDHEGRQYLDFFAGISTVSVGHCNEEVNKVMIEQMGQLQHTSTIFLTEPMVRFAEKLAEISPGDLQKAWITNSGTEANEGAILLAKSYTKSYEVMALRHSYHGRSYLTGSLTAQSNWRVDGPPVPGISFVSNSYCYRCPFGLEYPSCDMKCAYEVERVIETTTSGNVACMIAEPIQGVGGIITPPPEYFKIVKEILEKHGILFIADEVQTGFGRTGTKMFGIEQYGVEPDMMTMAKGIANGIPCGAYIAKAEVADALSAQTVNTYGGNPVSSVAAMATIDYIIQNRLQDNAQVVGDYMFERLRSMQEKSKLIGDVRGMGLMIGVELVKDKQTKEHAPDIAKAVVDTCRADGVLLGKGGLKGNTLRIQPPLIISKSDADTALDSLEKALESAEQSV